VLVVLLQVCLLVCLSSVVKCDFYGLEVTYGHAEFHGYQHVKDDGEFAMNIVAIFADRFDSDDCRVVEQ